MATVGHDLAIRGRAAQRVLARVDRARKDASLHAIADAIGERRDAIAEANSADLAQGREDGLSAALLDRLTLDGPRIDALAGAARAIAALPDPCGEADAGWRLPNDLDVARVRVPLGRVLVVYEARPNVTIDVAALCLKSGNVAILRGSRSARATNAALLEAVHAGLAASGLPADAAIALEASREELAAVVADPANADVVDPARRRGAEGLPARARAHSGARGGRRQLPRVRRRDRGSGDGAPDRDQREDAAPGSLQRGRDAARPRRRGPSRAARPARRLHARGVELRGDAGTRDLAGATPVAAADDDDSRRSSSTWSRGARGRLTR